MPTMNAELVLSTDQQPDWLRVFPQPSSYTKSKLAQWLAAWSPRDGTLATHRYESTVYPRPADRAQGAERENRSDPPGRCAL
jgi:hypothetical protein